MDPDPTFICWNQIPDLKEKILNHKNGFFSVKQNLLTKKRCSFYCIMILKWSETRRDPGSGTILFHGSGKNISIRSGSSFVNLQYSSKEARF